MPEAAVHRLDARDPHLASAPSEHSAVGELTAAAGVEGAVLEDHGARARVHHAGPEDEHVRMLVAEIA
jgi:hypothetical protein